MNHALINTGLFLLAVSCRSPDTPPIEPQGPGPEPPSIPVNDAGPEPNPGEPETDPGQPLGPFTELAHEGEQPDAGADAGPVGQKAE